MGPTEEPEEPFLCLPLRFYWPIEDVSGLFLSCSAARLVKPKGLLNLSSAWSSRWRQEKQESFLCWGDHHIKFEVPWPLHSNHQVFPWALHCQTWSLQEGSPLKMIAGTWNNFRLFQTPLVKIYDHFNRANVHRGGGFLLLYINANGFQAWCKENRWCWDGETPASEDFMLTNFPLTCRIRVSELLWMALHLLMILHEQTHTFKHVQPCLFIKKHPKWAVYQPRWHIRLRKAQQACNNSLQKYDPDKGEKPPLLSCVEAHWHRL